ncbi:MAG: type 4a pilus biogenesis protein PilO [Candidatus Firestonebacteria bacterium]
MSKDQIQKYALIAIVAGAAVYGYVFELYLPTLKNVSSLRAELQSKKGSYEEAKRKAADYEKLKKDAKKAELDLLFTMRRLPNTDNQPECIKEISRAAAENNITIQSFTPGKMVPGKSFYDEVPIALNLSGNYNNFGEFITKLGYSIRLLNCFDVQFFVAGLGGNNISAKGSVNMAVSLKTFVSTQNVVTQSKYSRGEDTEERAIYPLYRYVCALRDPFVSIVMEESKAVAENINIMGLSLTGVMALGKNPIFVFEDNTHNAFLLIDRKFYTKEKLLIKGIEGRVDGNKIKLAYTDNIEVGTKEKYFEIPK